MKKKVWDITVKDNPNRVVMGENDEFYTTDTEAYLVFKLDDENFNPATAVLTLENRNDGSLKNETVDVVDGLIEWEMPQRYIEHFGNWQGQLVYEDTKDGQPELYTSAPFSFVVNAHIGDKKQPSLVEIENWEKFIRDGTELIETWEDMEDLRQANEAQRQSNYQELLDTGVLQTNINTKLEQLEEEYAPKLTDVTAQLAQTESELDGTNQRIDNLVIPISPENSNLEVTDAHVSIVKGKTFNSLTNRFEESEKDVAAIQGDLLKNLVHNGKPKSLDGWGAGTHLSMAAVDGSLELSVKTPLAYNSNLIAPKSIEWVASHVYYVSSEYNVSKDGLVRIRAGGNYIDLAFTPSVLNQFQRYSAVFTQETSVTERFEFRHSTTEYDIGEKFYVKNFLVIDLTAQFGVGKEPTKEEMDTLLLKFNNWFDGETPFISLSDVYKELMSKTGSDTITDTVTNKKYKYWISLNDGRMVLNTEEVI